MARSTGAPAWGRARLRVRWVGVRSPAGWSFEAGGDVGSGAGAGAVGEDWDTLAFADTDDLVGAGGGQVGGAARKGG